jgi:tRNA modification GTPase
MIAVPENQTIVAHCSPIGSGAVALLRVSGDDVLSILAPICALASKKSLSAVPSHTIHYGTVHDAQGHVIDHVLFLVMHGPRTFTGQHTVEITAHNNVFIIEALINRIIESGARLAHNGEFTQRAVLNNKIDLLQAEAINELIHANTQQALKKSLAQLDGSFSAQIESIEKALIAAIALAQASFEFLDEETTEFGTQITTIAQDTCAYIHNLKRNFNQQQRIRQGIRIALIGSVNAGKSSLFNALIGTSRAIVSPVAGTTRDVIEAGIYTLGNYWTLVDTAGLRQAEDVIEQEGIRRSLEQAHLADVIILVCDASKLLSAEEQAVYQQLLDRYEHKILLVANKTDLPVKISLPQWHHEAIMVSTATGHGLQDLEAALRTKIDCLLTGADAPFLLNKRHYHLLLELEKRLLETISMLKKEPIPFELVAHHLTEAISDTAQLTGKSISETAMDAVFREFCVGK